MYNTIMENKKLNEQLYKMKSLMTEQEVQEDMLDDIKDYLYGKVQGVKSGNVMMKGMKYRVSITGQEIFCDGTTVWTYDVAAKEVQVAAVDNSSGSITPQKLFTNFYDKDFLFVLNPEIKKNGKTYQVIELTPIDKTKAFFKKPNHRKETPAYSKFYDRTAKKK